MPSSDLTPNPQVNADRIREYLATALATDIAGLAELLATETDRDLFGATAFPVRDLVHAIGAKALQAAADRQKSQLRLVPVEDAQTATGRPNSTAGRANRSSPRSAR